MHGDGNTSNDEIARMQEMPVRQAETTRLAGTVNGRLRYYHVVDTSSRHFCTWVAAVVRKRKCEINKKSNKIHKKIYFF